MFLAEVIAISEIAHFLWLLATPYIYKVWCKQRYIHIWVLASTLDPSVSKINETLSVTYKLLFILSKNIVPSRSYRYIRDRAFPVTRLPPPIYTKFDVSNGIYIHLGAGKHPSPLDISESYSPHLYLKVGFYLIKKYCSCPKLSQFQDRALLWLVPAPIYTCCDVNDDIHIWEIYMRDIYRYRDNGRWHLLETSYRLQLSR